MPSVHFTCGVRREPMSAFGALFSTVPLEDGSYTRLPAHVPPGPRPRTRIPMRTRGLRSDCSSSSSTPNGTPNSSEVHAKPYMSPKTHLAARAVANAEQVRSSSQAPTSLSSWWTSVTTALRPADSQTASSKPVLVKTVPSRKHGDMLSCCFREEKHDSFRACDPILEESAEVEFAEDMTLLELRSLLRHHNIEPNNGLINDMLHWQSRAVRDEPPSPLTAQHYNSHMHSRCVSGCCCCCCRHSAYTLMGRDSEGQPAATNSMATQLT